MYRIGLPNGYYIDVDELNYTLMRTCVVTGKKDKQQRESVKRVGYYKRIETALEAFLKCNQTDLLNSQAVSIDEYAKLIDVINKTAVKSLKSLVEGNQKDGGCSF